MITTGALAGLVFGIGIADLILAVPVTVIARDAIARLRLNAPGVPCTTCTTDLDAADPLILRERPVPTCSVGHAVEG